MRHPEGLSSKSFIQISKVFIVPVITIIRTSPVMYASLSLVYLWAIISKSLADNEGAVDEPLVGAPGLPAFPPRFRAHSPMNPPVSRLEPVMLYRAL